MSYYHLHKADKETEAPRLIGNWLKFVRLASHTVTQGGNQSHSLAPAHRELTHLLLPAPGKEQGLARAFIWIYPISWEEIRDFTVTQPFHSESGLVL